MAEHRSGKMEEGNDSKYDRQRSCIPAKIAQNWFRHFQYDPTRDSASEVRNILLIIATLIATVTFQGGVNPPGGIWQDNDDGHSAGRAIYASHQIAFYVFLVSNTFALSTSLLVIVCLTYRFPLHFEIWVATASMMVTYASAIFAVTPHESVRFRYVLIAGVLPVICRCVFQMYGKLNNRSMQSPKSVSQQNGALDNSQG
ncbi:hypothetical protein BT93_L0830 [Corymbia citriodora subsp. variegata]|uniref:PGG domain-containing protein n=1 Tax=Corymbia citriodora subsp. variegata TaxID=360336 RepID=A0A8T0CQE3_CORYI|nr:hypothetical protein BT93_L0830 [Corymbia citriodora subsp. variegata]